MHLFPVIKQFNQLLNCTQLAPKKNSEDDNRVGVKG